MRVHDAGVVAIALAKAGADLVATDLAHITPLTLENVNLNCSPLLHRCQARSLIPRGSSNSFVIRLSLINLYTSVGFKSGDF